MLADRARTPLLLAAVASIGVAAFAFWPRHVPEPRRCGASIVVTTAKPAAVPSVEASEDCPPHVRTAMHLGKDATLYCVRGLYPEPGTFVFAQYRTTETWERFAVVSDEGHLIVPMVDRPRR